MKYLEKTIQYGLYLLVFLLPLQSRWIIKYGELNDFGSISLYGTDILLILLLAIFLVSKFLISPSASLRASKSEFLNKSQNPKPKTQNKLLWFLIAGLELMVFISIFVAPDKLLALYKYGVFLLGIGLFWLITSAYYNKFKLVFSFLAGIFLQACLGIWQFLTQSSFANKWLGMALHNPGDLGTSVVETLSGERWLRAYGGLDHPNVLGGLLAAGIILLAGKILEYSRFILEITRENYKKYYPNLLRLILMDLVLVIFITALFFTFSRGAWAGAIVGLIIMMGIAVYKKDLASQKNLLKIVLYSSVLVLILFNLFSDQALTRLSQDTRLEVKSNTERIESYNTAWRIIKNHLLLGNGIGNYTLAVHNEIDNKQPGYYYQPAHNTFLLVLAEVGIIGFIAFIFLITFSIFNFQFLIFKQFSIFQFSIILSIITMMMVDHWWWSLHFGVLFFWFIMGLTYREERSD